MRNGELQCLGTDGGFDRLATTRTVELLRSVMAAGL